MIERNGTQLRLDLPSTPEWDDFRDRVVDHRKRLERVLRREIVHDPRAARCRIQNFAAGDLADEALVQALDEWRSKPSETPPFEWMLKRGLLLLDEALDRESLAADSRAEERDAEQRLLAHELLHDDEERARWLEVAGLAHVERDVDADTETDVVTADVDTSSVAFAETDDDDALDRHEFDGLASPPDASSPAVRMEQAETLLELERALLRLPEQRRRAVAHRFLDGLDIDEIAYLLDLQPDEVEIELSRGLQDLRTELRS